MPKNITIYYATNRKHRGSNRWKPTGYGSDFSSDGRENLRLGKVTLRGEATKIRKLLDKEDDEGRGNGGALAKYFARLCRSSRSRTIRAFEEKLQVDLPEEQQNESAYGSRAMFKELQEVMLASSDVLVFVHGFNVDWNEAVGSAAALQEMLNDELESAVRQPLTVVLFTWPSDGSAMPFAAYKSDRADAEDSGKAIGRGFLKLRDFLVSLRGIDGQATPGVELCKRELHLLCHSMGNYVLENALQRLAEFSHGSRLPRLFEQVFLCSPDVDDDALEPEQPMGRLHEIARGVTVYFNRGDNALRGSDITKGNPDRLGSGGAARPTLIHSKIHQVDCHRVADGLMEHSYFMKGYVNDDIQMSIAGVPQDDGRRTRRVRDAIANNTWMMRR